MHLFSSLALLLSTLIIHAQPQWRFHVAFENSAGARDTIWFIYDTTATFGIDTHLGQGPVTMDPDVFNVWTYNADGDSTKSHAWPYEAYPYGMVYMYLQHNAVDLANVRWDTTLFHAPYLPSTPTRYFRYAFLCDYYFAMTGMESEPGTLCYSMFQSDGIVIDPSWAEWFFGPVMIFSYDYPFTIGMDEYSLPSLEIYPNPAQSRMVLSAPEPLTEVLVLDALGRAVLRVAPPGLGPVEVNVSTLPAGSYFVHARGRASMYRGKVVVE